MDEPKAAGQLGCWLRSAIFVAITIAYAWYLTGFIKLAGVVVLSLIGGVLSFSGLWLLFKSVIKSPISIGGIVFALIILCFGSLALLPGAPDSLLLKTPIGWSVLEHRTKKLERAIRDNNVDRVRKIARVGVGDTAPRDGFGNPLIADAIKRPELMRILLASGLDADARFEGGGTLLMRTYDEEVAKVLLEFGADVNARDDEGLTPLMRVVTTNLGVVKVLVEAGADVQMSDDLGRTVADLMSSQPDIEEFLTSHYGAQLRSGNEREYKDIAKRDWLTRVGVADGMTIEPSEIRLDPDPMKYGDLAELEIRLSNSSDVDRVMQVKAHLNSVAMFVDADFGGKIANPHQPQSDQEILWPRLALPARSSGTLRMTILARSEWDAGDLTVDIRAQNVLDYAETSAIYLNLYQPLSQATYRDQDYRGWAFILIFPGVLLVWIACRKVLGAGHRITGLSGRAAAGIFAVLGALIAYQLVGEALSPYRDYRETQAVILDRRFYLKSSTSTSSSSRSSSRIYQVPIVCARYQTTSGQVVAAGLAHQIQSLHILRDYRLGAEVTCWYDPDQPKKFVLVRGVSVLFVVGTLISAAGSLLLAWLALRRKVKTSDASSNR